MLRLGDPGLPPETAAGLRRYQAEVDGAGEYARRVAAGNGLFARYNRPHNPVFSAVRDRLDRMCWGARRCCYCEDSAANEIEHIRPKSLYPERTFVWENYLYACGDCNKRKGAQFAVMDGSRAVNVARRRGAPVAPPRPGQPALVNPREEDPLDFLDLEIEETFRFLARLDLSPVQEARAAYTIDTLGLNRVVLRKAREEAYGYYRARLVEYREVRDGGADEPELSVLSTAIVASAHPTVWREMKRHRDLIDELTALFAAVPEALDW